MYTNSKYKTALSEPKKMALIREFKNELIKELELPKAFDNLNHVEQQKQVLYKQLSELGEKVFNAPNPRFAARQFLIDNMLKLSSLEVLSPKNNPNQFQTSGELFPYLRQIIVKNPALLPLFKSFDIKSNSPEEDYLNALIGSMFILGLWNKAIRIILILIEDVPGEGELEWADPCYNSFCISHEYAYRKELGLPQYVTHEDFEKEVHLHAAWLEIFPQDHDDIRKAWGTLWINVLGKDDPFKEFGY